MSETRLRAVLAWVVIVLLAVPVGGAVLLGVVHGDSPCILCWAQRTSMALIALTGLFVLRYGPRPRYLGLAVLLAAWGTFMALRHSGLHLARDIGQGFAAPILGVHTYAWSWVIHFVALVVIAVLLMLLRSVESDGTPRDLGPRGRAALGLFAVVITANALQAFATTGPPPFMGQADPLRLSLNPKRWVWLATDELSGAVSLRGAWDVRLPDLAALDPDPAHGPLQRLPSLTASCLTQSVTMEGGLADLARDPATGRLATVSEDHHVVVYDSTLTEVLHHVVLDPGFAVQLSALAGVAFLGDTVAVMATNKSYALLRPDPAADEGAQWRHFRSTTGHVAELRRSRLATVRARQQYVMSLAFDPAAQELITVSVPSARHPRVVVSRFARGDYTLSSEFVLRAGPGLTLGADRSVAEYVVTGAVADGGMLYAISAAYSTLLVVDLAGRDVRAAYAVAGLTGPSGLALAGSKLLIGQRDGCLVEIDRPR